MFTRIRGWTPGKRSGDWLNTGRTSWPTEPPPSVWVVGRGQLVNPMNIMLLLVVAASFAIVQIPTALVVLGLVTFNVVMGTSQELKARASVEALAKLQVPHARVRRSGQVEQIESTGLVPGDIVLLEAGDVVPADGRIESSATLEVQEAALTGESAPIPKDAGTLPGGEVALGDRTNLVFQNTQVTRGTATIVVTATGSATEMGKIAGMVTATQRTQSPLQRELDGMTKVFGTIAFAAVLIIAIFGLVRGQDTTTLVLLCISTAIASIPTGLPTFVQAMLSSGARRLAEHKAVVKSLSDVETLGGTTVINSDKTGTLTMNAMTATQMLGGGDWFKIEGPGYAKTGAILGVAGAQPPGLPQPGPGPGAVHRRHRRRRRVGHRRPDRGGVRGAGREDGRGRRGDPRSPAPPGRGAVRFRVQVHGHLPRPPGLAGRPARPATAPGHRQRRPGCGPGPLRPGPVAWPAGADRHRPGRAPGRQPQAVRARAAGPRVRRQGHG